MADNARWSLIDALLFLVYAGASVAGLVVIKSWIAPARAALAEGALASTPVFAFGCGAALYVVSFGLWIVILGRHDLSVAYPIAVSLTLVLSTVLASTILGESVSMGKLAGIGVVFLGIWLVARG